jgi:NAD(P)-dependent dehydrogenase (short-subunit alcohol dehydrogenase family)
VTSFGGIDVLVNSAAIMVRMPFGEVDARRWDQTIDLNLRAPFFLTQAAATHLRKARGVVVNIADLAAFETWPGYIPHGIAKSGIVYVTRALAAVLAPEVRVAAIAPGTVLLPEGWASKTPRDFVARRPRAEGSPEDVARTMLFILESDYLTGERSSSTVGGMSDDDASPQRYGRVVIVGGGCYGSYYVRQLLRAIEAGAVEARELWWWTRTRSARLRASTDRQRRW